MDWADFRLGGGRRGLGWWGGGGVGDSMPDHDIMSGASGPLWTWLVNCQERRGG